MGAPQSDSGTPLNHDSRSYLQDRDVVRLKAKRPTALYGVEELSQVAIAAGKEQLDPSAQVYVVPLFCTLRYNPLLAAPSSCL